MSDYTCEVTQTADGKYRATCVEFPRLFFVADDEDAALAGIRQMVLDERQRNQGQQLVIDLSAAVYIRMFEVSFVMKAREPSEVTMI